MGSTQHMLVGVSLANPRCRVCIVDSRRSSQEHCFRCLDLGNDKESVAAFWPDRIEHAIRLRAGKIPTVLNRKHKSGDRHETEERGMMRGIKKRTLAMPVPQDNRPLQLERYVGPDSHRHTNRGASTNPISCAINHLQECDVTRTCLLRTQHRRPSASHPRSQFGTAF